MMRVGLLVCVLLGICLTLTAHPKLPGGIDVGDTAPSLGCKDSSGVAVEWADFGSKSIIVYFHSANTSRADRALELLADALRKDLDLGKKAALVVVVDDLASGEKAAKTLGSMGCELRIAVTKDRGPHTQYGVIAFPSVYVLNPQHAVVDVIKGYSALFAYRIATAARFAAGMIDEEEFHRSLLHPGATDSIVDPKVSRTLALAKHLVAAGKMDLARTALEQEPRIQDEGNQEAALFLVSLLLATEDYEAAGAWLEKLGAETSSDPRLTLLHLQWTIVHGELESPTSRLESFHQDNPRVRLIRGMILERQDDLPAAVVLYRRTLEELLLMRE